jgi:hypothetical protein
MMENDRKVFAMFTSGVHISTMTRMLSVSIHNAHFFHLISGNRKSFRVRALVAGFQRFSDRFSDQQNASSEPQWSRS